MSPCSRCCRRLPGWGVCRDGAEDVDGGRVDAAGSGGHLDPGDPAVGCVVNRLRFWAGMVLLMVVFEVTWWLWH